MAWIACKTTFLLLVLGVALKDLDAVPSSNKRAGSTNETEAKEWFVQFDKDLGNAKYTVGEASWLRSTNTTKESTDNYIRANLVYIKFLQDKREEMDRRFNWKEFTDKNLTRAFSKAADIGTSSVKDEQKQQRLSELTTRLSEIYNDAVVADPDDANRKMPLEPDLVRIMADPTASEARKRAVWKGWRDAAGKPMKPVYEEFAKLSNSMIEEAGYKNVADYWQSWYETPNFENLMDSLWEELKPFYQQLHAYVKTKLIQKYGGDIFPPTGQIPAHILGNMWAQSWQAVESFATPFPDVNKVDVTEQMKKLNWNAKKMFEVSEEFFTSIGLKNMTETFWKKSVIEKIEGVRMVCHASAWDFYTGKGDFRIKQCTDITSAYLATTHHEMGHVQYYLEYEPQPVVYRRGANPGFHEAVGDVIELSVMTPEHLKTIGLLETTIDSREYYINYLFQMALKKIAFIPFGFLMDKWRWRVYDGTTTSEKYNEEWWKLRCGIQGVASPVLRSNEDFDAGSKYHIPSNTPYIRYFVSHILQFQFQEALCKAAGITGELYKCDIYRNKNAGAKLSAALSKGSSELWPDVLRELTGSDKMSVQPLLNYFKDLHDFLIEENKKSGVKVGWDANCPGRDWYEKGAGLNRQNLLTSVGLLMAAFFFVRGNF